MDDLGILARDFGIRPQGKSAPMSASKSTAPSGSGRPAAAEPTWNKPRSGSSWTSTPAGEPLFSGSAGGGGISGDRVPPSYDDVFGGQPRKSSTPPSFDSLFEGYKDPAPKSSSLPVYDKPVYDDDIFDGVPGMKSSSSVQYEDVFVSMASAAERVSSPPYDDLLGSLGKGMPETKGLETKDKDASAFEELIPGFAGSIPAQKRHSVEENHHESAKPVTTMTEDPFVVLEKSSSMHQTSRSYDDPLEHMGKSMSSRSTRNFSVSTGVGIFDDFDGLVKSVPSFTPDINDITKEKSSRKADQSTSSACSFGEMEPPPRSSMDTFDNAAFSIPATKTSDSQKSLDSQNSQNSGPTPNAFEQNFPSDQSPKSHQHAEAVDVWLTISEIPLFTKPTTAPPPSRPPPSIIGKKSPFRRFDEPALPVLSGRRKDTDSLLQSNQSNSYSMDAVMRSSTSIDELEDFAMAKPQRYPSERADVFSTEEDIDANLRDAMGRAEAKFRHAKEVRERERDAKTARNRDYVSHERVERAVPDSHESEHREKQEQLDLERIRREREEKEEQKRLEKEREQQERERARQAVERATREARERAAVEARQKAERAAAEKARQQSDRLAFQRAAAEARERAANEARERAEKAKVTAEREKAAAAEKEKVAATAKEKAAAEARERAAAERATAEARQRAAERAAVERAAAEARDRAAAEAREKAAAAAREKQNKADDDLESFFGMGSRASSAPKQRAATSENIFDTRFPSSGSSETRSSSSVSNINMKKASSVTNIADDLSAIFGGPQSPGEFQEVEGETEERRRARFERHQRTLERAAKALAEKNERDMQMQNEQAERHRIAETVDIEIKRWAAGKEGNLRALLSTLHYVLWEKSGWDPVSLADLMTGASVKKVYRKATLCIHPDKVQQKGATLQQKYIAEKVFDLLKEAWNKFNSEELF
ncbi:Auxilin-related protein 1 [Apostasia shenzhenica]|uniref:Auxilin-related protein 1 n=1 Tax=Apostasia shenzhenica TaxID=1088818 RepID=A0A2I0B596_9ASPA|nr:Auxilin-related protein 1 [Apostasia shenzhenica]